MKIFIDPAHGGRDRANRGPTGYVEADGTLDISARLRYLLEKHPGLEVNMSRQVNETVLLYDRPRFANEWGAGLLVSIHTNAAASPEANGIEVYHSSNGDWGDIFLADARKLAVLILEEVVKATGLRNRGVKSRLVERKSSPIYGMDYFAVIRRVKCPAVIIAIGFHTNPVEEALLKTSLFRQKAAEGVAAGIINYINLNNKNVKPNLFVDVPTNHWAANAIKFVSEMEQSLISGFSDGTLFIIYCS